MSKNDSFCCGRHVHGPPGACIQWVCKFRSEKIKNDVEKVMDLNRDGKIDHQDAKIAIERLNGALSFNMPAGGGFTAGLLMGLKSS